MNIAVIGTGYVGLVTGTCFAETGNYVTCVDIDESKVNQLKAGSITIYEPGLEILFSRNFKQGRLKFTTSLEEGVKDAKVIFLALPTPPGDDGAADLRYVLDVSRKLGILLKDYSIIVNKSTVPVGTADRVNKVIAEKAKFEFDVVSNPEFLREGVAVDDFMKPDRIVVGTKSDRAKKVMEELYKPFVRQGNPIIFMDEYSSELTKYAANSFLAMKITFMNEIANLCDLVGADVDHVRRGVGTDSRIGRRFLFAGIGYGGSCFPKDVKALKQTAVENNYDFQILNAVINVNDKQKTILFPKIKGYFKNDLQGKLIAIWGVAFKPNTDDVREAAAIYMINKLLDTGAKINSFDPEALDNIKEIFGNRINYSTNQYEALENADALLILTEWPVFRNPDFDKMFSLLKNKVIFDGRNLFEHETMKEMGVYYVSIGRNLT